ncbi:MAG: helix-turn-helix domain-containing protein [Saprospiraceae bacterium]
MKEETKLVKSKFGLLALAEKLGNVTKACKHCGYSRDTYYRLKQLYDENGDVGITVLNRKKPNHKNRISLYIEQKVINFSLKNPSFGQLKVSKNLKKSGTFISAGGVRCVWLRHGLENYEKRINAGVEKTNLN